MGADGEVGVVDAEMLRRSQVVRRDMLLFGLFGAGGVTGLEHSAIVLSRDGGARVKPVVRRRVVLKVVGEDLLLDRGAEKAEPMSERVSERTCIRIEGAMEGT